MKTTSIARTGHATSRWVCQSCLSKLAAVKPSTSSSSYRSRDFASSSRSAAYTPSNPSKLPRGPARTRFAPSPTGDLHLGSIRTALFNYLLARRTNGQFLLRLEDTDQKKRTIPGAEERLYKDLRWAGLEWDEGPVMGGPYGPYRQSERLYLYNIHIQTLLQNRRAYTCFCSSERIDTLNRLRHDKGLPLGYDRKCIHIDPAEAKERAARGEPHTIRFHVPKEYPQYTDFIYGKTGRGSSAKSNAHIDNPVYDDPVLIKSDGYPTYHFANVIDDKLMQITHVIRGSEWMSSTPLHVALYEAFDWSPPAFAHVPLLVDRNGQKLSKRNVDTSIASFGLERRIFPQTITNFAALLGWSHKQSSDVMDLSQLEAVFDLKFTKGNTIVAFEKLDFLQEQHAKRIIAAGGEPLEQIIRDVAVALLDTYGAGVITKWIGSRKLRDVIAAMLRIESLPYQNPKQFAESVKVLVDATSTSRSSRPPLRDTIAELTLLPQLRIATSALLLVPPDEWHRVSHRANLAQLTITPDPIAIPEKVAKKDFYTFLRWALLDGNKGPSIPDTMELLGRDICQSRLKEAVLEAKDLANEVVKPTIIANRVPKGQGNSRWAAHKLPSTQETSAVG